MRPRASGFRGLGDVYKRQPALVNRSMVTHMEEGQPLEPAVIGKTRYYSDYRGKNGRRSYIQDILAAVQKPISADRHDDGQRAG